MAVLSGDRFWMKLDAFNRQRLVAQAHDLAVDGPRGDIETIRQRRSLDRERVVARGLERRRQAAEYTGTGVRDRRRLAVHQCLRADDLAAESLSERLMTQADAENRPIRKSLEDAERNAGLVRRTRPR